MCEARRGRQTDVPSSDHGDLRHGWFDLLLRAPTRHSETRRQPGPARASCSAPNASVPRLAARQPTDRARGGPPAFGCGRLPVVAPARTNLVAWLRRAPPHSPPVGGSTMRRTGRSTSPTNQEGPDVRNALGAVQSVLVLGGASDIGAEVAARLVRDGARSIVLA